MGTSMNKASALGLFTYCVAMYAIACLGVGLSRTAESPPYLDRTLAPLI